MKRVNKKGFAFPIELPPQWIIALVLLAIAIGGLILTFKIKGEGAIEFFKNLWRFR